MIYKNTGGIRSYIIREMPSTAWDKCNLPSERSVSNGEISCRSCTWMDNATFFFLWEKKHVRVSWPIEQSSVCTNEDIAIDDICVFSKVESTHFAFVGVKAPRLQRDDAGEGAYDSIVGREDLGVAPWTVQELIIGNPPKALRELRPADAAAGVPHVLLLLYKCNPRRIICWDTYLPVVHALQQRFDGVHTFLDLIRHWNLLAHNMFDHPKANQNRVHQDNSI